MNKEDRNFVYKAIEPLKEDVSAMKEQIKFNSLEIHQRVTYKTFFSILAILISISTGIAGYIIFQISDLQAKTYEISKDVSGIGAVLNNIEFINLD